VFSCSAFSLLRTVIGHGNEKFGAASHAGTKRQDDLRHMSVGSWSDSGRRVGLLAGERRQRRRMSPRPPLRLMSAELKAQWRGARRPRRRWIDDGRANAAETSGKTTDRTYSRTRLLYVAITSASSRLDTAPSEPLPLADFVKCSLSPSETSNFN